MRLSSTGAFLRALRDARLTGTRYVSASSLPTVRCQRYFATTPRLLTSPVAFPEQSVSQSSEIDPRKTEALSEESQWESKDAQFLASQPQHKIIKDAATSRSGVNILGGPYVFDSTTNVTESILGLVGRKLYDTPNHPIAITRKLIESVFRPPRFEHHTAANPVVSTKDNFDVLGFPPDHPGRSRTDTYYVDSKTVLRTHTSAHQHAAFQRLRYKGDAGYTICADVYRRDSIDRSHFPVFHQMEAACVWKLRPPKEGIHTRLQQQDARAHHIRSNTEGIPRHNLEIIDEAGSYDDQTNPVQIVHDPDEAQLVVENLKRSLENLVQKVFVAAQAAQPDVKHEPLKVRWIEAYFPFTSPSFELEVFWQGEWLELLGCGVTKQEILDNAGLRDHIGWAWGLGIERLAMVLFDIPDIRLFWSQDERFLKQFKQGQITRFKSFSKYPPCYKDISFWVRPSPAAASPIGAQSSSGAAAAAGGDATKASPAETQPAAFHENDIMEIVRDVAGTLAEDVKLVDEFVHPKSGKKSLCYRVNYRSHERTLTNEETNDMHEKVTRKVAELPVEIR